MPKILSSTPNIYHMRTHEVSDILAPADNSHKDVINIGAGNDINPIIENNLKKDTLKILPINRQLTPLFKGKVYLIQFDLIPLILS